MELEYWIWLLKKDNIGSKKMKNLIYYFGNIENVYKETSCIEYMNAGLKENEAKLLSEDKDLSWEDTLVEYMSEEEISAVNFFDEDYPEILRNISSAPMLLFYKGANLFSSFTSGIGIVGAREATDYGLEQAKKIAWELSDMGVCVVSGLARGIDAFAHKGAMKGKAKTIAVLGCGVDIGYPRSNNKLYEEIINAGGMVISELLPKTPPRASNFPIRNRIISGLSKGSLVVEANIKSGSLITAKYARQQSRTVYALPGRVDSRMSSGTNKLIKEGAKIVLSANDILEDLGYNPIKKEYEYKEEKVENLYHKIQLSGIEMEIIKQIKNLNDVNVISRKLGITSNELSSTLTMLELKGAISKRNGAYIIKY